MSSDLLQDMQLFIQPLDEVSLIRIMIIPSTIIFDYTSFEYGRNKGKMFGLIVFNILN